jgi:hypothetical protein
VDFSHASQGQAFNTSRVRSLRLDATRLVGGRALFFGRLVDYRRLGGTQLQPVVPVIGDACRGCGDDRDLSRPRSSRCAESNSAYYSSPIIQCRACSI